LSKEHAPDGIHPVADAYTLMEAEVMKAIKKVVKIK
jgi:lysophospholipase L1-like esterase